MIAYKFARERTCEPIRSVPAELEMPPVTAELEMPPVTAELEMPPVTAELEINTRVAWPCPNRGSVYGVVQLFSHS